MRRFKVPSVWTVILAVGAVANLYNGYWIWGCFFGGAAIILYWKER